MLIDRQTDRPPHNSIKPLYQKTLKIGIIFLLQHW